MLVAGEVARLYVQTQSDPKESARLVTAACLSACLHACRRACLPACLPACLVAVAAVRAPLRPPTALGAHAHAQGGPLSPRGESSPLRAAEGRLRRPESPILLPPGLPGRPRLG